MLSGDDFLTHPIAGLGVVPLLIEVAAQFEAGTLEPLEIIERSSVERVAVGGIWQHLKAPALPLVDLAVLTAASGDALAANALLQRVGLDAVRARIESLGLKRAALLDRLRDERGPDDAPHYALGSAGELAGIFGALVNSQIVSPGVSAQVAEWLSLNHDLSLVASATGLDPFSHENDEHGLLFINKTGRDTGIRVEAGVLAGPAGGHLVRADRVLRRPVDRAPAAGAGGLPHPGRRPHGVRVLSRRGPLVGRPGPVRLLQSDRERPTDAPGFDRGRCDGGVRAGVAARSRAGSRRGCSWR